MTARRLLEAAGFAGLFAALAYSWIALAPGAPLLAYAVNPAYFALVAATVTVSAYLALRLLPLRRPSLERLLLALFLAGMPVVYLWGALLAEDNAGMALETLGLGVFAATAVAGYRRSALLLGIGIAAHGIGWDAWHHNHTAYIEPWYPAGCFLVDVAFGLLVALQHFGPRALARQSAPVHANTSRERPLTQTSGHSRRSQ